MPDTPSPLGTHTQPGVDPSTATVRTTPPGGGLGTALPTHAQPGQQSDHDPALAAVTALLAGLHRLDVDSVLGLLADDVVYQNVSLPAARGREAVTKQLRMFARLADGFDATNHKILSDGHTVLTERTDVMTVRGVRLEFWVCGTFEVRDGKITLWRDYFDWANLLAGTASGAGKALVGLLRRVRG